MTPEAQPTSKERDLTSALSALLQFAKDPNLAACTTYLGFMRREDAIRNAERALDAVALSTPSPTGTELALAEARRHIDVLCRFVMDNERWVRVSNEAFAFIGGKPK